MQEECFTNNELQMSLVLSATGRSYKFVSLMSSPSPKEAFLRIKLVGVGGVSLHFNSWKEQVSTNIKYLQRWKKVYTQHWHNISISFCLIIIKHSHNW